MAKDWIAEAVGKHKGALHRDLNVPKGEKIPKTKLEQGLHSASQKTRRRAKLAMELKGFNS